MTEPSTSYDTRAHNERIELSAVELQQSFYEARGDADWELFEKKDRHFLLQKIAVALCGPPTEEGNLTRYESHIELQGYDLKSKEICMEVFKKICKQDIYSTNGENIFISILRVIFVCPSKDVPLLKAEPKNYWVNLHLKKGKDVNIAVFHLFSIRKCISLKNGVKGCRIFIDHDARIYKDWKSYLEENNLPKGVLVLPANGEYKGIKDEILEEFDGSTAPRVQLSVVPSPALGLGARVLSVADTASIAAPIGALVGIVGGLAFPVIAPAALATAAGVGVVTGVYGIVRSSFKLADRKKHGQNIGLREAEARGCWINILMSSVGLSFSAAGKLLSMAARSGTNLTVFINALQFFKYTSIATGFIGVVNSLGEMIYKYYKYDEKPTKLELFQFTSSLLFFGIGVMSNQTAQEIVQDAQAKKINEIRDSLSSNAKRKIFDKVTAETRRLEGTVKGNSDVIRALNNIDNKDEFFAKLGRINKEVNQNKVRISLTSDGSPLINNQHKVSIVELDGLGKDGRNQLFGKYGRAKVTTKNAPTRIYSSKVSANAPGTSQESSTFTVNPEEIYKIASLLYQLSKIEKDFLLEMLSKITADIHDNFLLLCADLILSLTAREVSYMSLGDRDYRIRIIFFVFNYLKSLLGSPDSFDPTDCSLGNLLKMFLVNGRIDKETLLNIKAELMSWWQDKKNRNPNQYPVDDLDIFIKLNKKKEDFMMIRAGEVLNIGKHKIVIKLITIEKLEEGLKGFNQHECDIIMEFYFKIIALLSKKEIDSCVLVNPDEDILMHIAKFMFEGGILEELVSIFIESDQVDEGIVEEVKTAFVYYINSITSRKHEICSICDGICYE